MNMAYADASAQRAQGVSQSVGVGSEAAETKTDDGFDFPPALHPGRELFTASLFFLLTISLLVWGCWKLMLTM
jgi:hypothetical protein